LVDFADYQEYDSDARQAALLKATREMKITDRPCMILDLAPMRALELVVDDVDWVEDGAAAKDEYPPCARILMPVSHIVDLKGIKPLAGKSIIRVNGSIPTPKWFQAANLQLHHDDKLGRVIPFPMEQENGDMTYQAIRVSPDEFKEYQALLVECVSRDGPDKGFYLSSKFSFEILRRRSGKDKMEEVEFTHQGVGNYITDFMIMGNSYMRGVLIANAEFDDFEDIEKNFIYI
jgi:hypothetical protein